MHTKIKEIDECLNSLADAKLKVVIGASGHLIVTNPAAWPEFFTNCEGISGWSVETLLLVYPELNHLDRKWTQKTIKVFSRSNPLCAGIGVPWFPEEDDENDR